MRGSQPLRACRRSFLAILLVLLLSTPAGEAVLVSKVSEYLKAHCGVTSPPEPGSLVKFMGKLQRVNTSTASFGYYRFGNTSSARPPLVLLPGLGSTIGDVRPQCLQDLAAGQEVVAFDFPGQGFSWEVELPQQVTVADVAEATMEFFDLLGLDKPNIMGVSMGGMVAAALAASYGERLGKVIMASSSAGSPNSEFPTTEALITVTSSFNDILAAEGGVADPANDTSGLDQPGALSLMFPLDLPAGQMGACDFMMGRAGGIDDPSNMTTTIRHASAIVQYFMSSEVWDGLAQQNNSFLLIAGQLDTLIPPKNSLVLVPHLRRPWLALYPQASHLVSLQEWESVLPLLDNFLEYA